MKRRTFLAWFAPILAMLGVKSAKGVMAVEPSGASNVSPYQMGTCNGQVDINALIDAWPDMSMLDGGGILYPTTAGVYPKRPERTNVECYRYVAVTGKKFFF